MWTYLPLSRGLESLLFARFEGGKLLDMCTRRKECETLAMLQGRWMHMGMIVTPPQHNL